MKQLLGRFSIGPVVVFRSHSKCVVPQGFSAMPSGISSSPPAEVTVT
jgi:hypothetical protein